MDDYVRTDSKGDTVSILDWAQFIDIKTFAQNSALNVLSGATHGSGCLVGWLKSVFNWEVD